MPRFQFGIHCPVIVASAVRIIAINAVAIRASTRVKPATRLRHLSSASCHLTAPRVKA